MMIGSAVPLHLAQIDTYAIRIWLGLNETRREEHWKVWLAAWPLVAAAIAAGWTL